MTTRWDDAVLAAALFATDPAGLKGIVVRGRPGPVLDRWLAVLRNLLPCDVPVRRLPFTIAPERLTGGLDLAASLSAGAAVATRGLLAETDGGVLIVPMAERMTADLAARLGGVLDTGEITAERDGLSLRSAARVGVVALDEGIEDERVPAALADRLAIHIDLNDAALRDCTEPESDADAVAHARDLLAHVEGPDTEITEGICATAMALGVGSLRASILALRVAQVAAALRSSRRVEAQDAAVAARLVLAPRATQIPLPPEADAADEDTADQASEASETERDPPEPQTGDGTDDAPDAPPEKLDDLLIAAVLASIPPDLLASLRLTQTRKPARSSAGSGAETIGAKRGRPTSSRKGTPSSTTRLDVIGTLCAAAPWQKVRRAERPARDHGRLDIRRDDFRIQRMKKRATSVAIFAVDASGSSALNRLAEAKGAVELLLAECYVRRDEVALIAFRGQRAEVVLPPTRSLARAKRTLAGLPGGGATPLAAGLEAAFTLAQPLLRKGHSPTIILLTDGRANITRSGQTGRAAAQDDARACARLIRAAGLPAVVIDTSPRPDPAAAGIAAEMAARYLPMPYAGAAALTAAVRELA